jgi:uncharacterized repeat protein (TIGR03803 family)
MRGKRISIGLRTTLAISIMNLLMANAWAATTKILYSFLAETGDHADAYIGAVDNAGNLYGTTSSTSEPTNCGTAYELTPTTGGTWVENTLYNFSGNFIGGCFPGPVILDSAGNLYGTTYYGQGASYGGVYELSPTTSGVWQLTVLYSSPALDQGGFPEAALTPDSAGNFYSTTSGGGAYYAGTVFELTPTVGGGWAGTTLFSFDSKDGGKDGNQIDSTMVVDASGNLYGTAYGGGAHRAGTVWELSPQIGGGWAFKELFNFTGGDDGGNPFPHPGALVMDSAGNLYGTTESGGQSGDGVVFELSPTAGGPWREKVLYSFGGRDGIQPDAGVIFDTFGNLYGETAIGGEANDGVVFELSPTAGGPWKETVLHSFSGSDGNEPVGGLISDSAGNLYGTTWAGGTYNVGTVFEITP